MDPSKKIQVVEINLDIDLEEEIKKETKVSDDIRIQLHDVVRSRMKNPKHVSKSKRIKKNFEPKFDKLFEVLVEEDSINKADFASVVGVKPEDIGPVVQRFKTYLREKHEGNWYLESKKKRNTRVYKLINIS